jgi:hypothetical protein
LFILLCTGFSKVIPKKYLQLYYPSALSKVVQSADSIDMAALRGRVEYDSPYHATHRVVRMFWHLVEKELTVEDVRKLLLFWTGSSIVPRDDVEDNKASRRRRHYAVLNTTESRAHISYTLLCAYRSDAHRLSVGRGAAVGVGQAEAPRGQHLPQPPLPARLWNTG